MLYVYPILAHRTNKMMWPLYLPFQWAWNAVLACFWSMFAPYIACPSDVNELQATIRNAQKSYIDWVDIPGTRRMNVNGKCTRISLKRMNNIVAYDTTTNVVQVMGGITWMQLNGVLITRRVVVPIQDIDPNHSVAVSVALNDKALSGKDAFVSSRLQRIVLMDATGTVHDLTREHWNHAIGTVGKTGLIVLVELKCTPMLTMHRQVSFVALTGATSICKTLHVTQKRSAKADSYYALLHMNPYKRIYKLEEIRATYFTIKHDQRGLYSYLRSTTASLRNALYSSIGTICPDDILVRMTPSQTLLPVSEVFCIQPMRSDGYKYYMSFNLPQDCILNYLRDYWAWGIYKCIEDHWCQIGCITGANHAITGAGTACEDKLQHTITIYANSLNVMEIIGRLGRLHAATFYASSSLPRSFTDSEEETKAWLLNSRLQPNEMHQWTDQSQLKRLEQLCIQYDPNNIFRCIL